MLLGAVGEGLAGLVDPRSRLRVERQAPGVEAYLRPVECSPTLDCSPLRKLEEVDGRGGDVHGFSVPDRAAPSSRSTIKPPDPDDVVRLLEAAAEDDPDLGMFLLVGAVTVARRGELCALRWTNVDLVNGSVLIDRVLIDVGGRRSTERPLGASTLQPSTSPGTCHQGICFHQETVRQG